MIVDTHVHIVSADESKYPRTVAGHAANWLRDMPVDADRLLGHMDEAGIDKAMIVQAAGAYLFDNGYAADAAGAHPDRFACVCIVDARQPDALDRLTYWVKERGVQGIRLFTSTDPEGTWLDDPKTFPLWRHAADLGVAVTVQVQGHQLYKVKAPIERFSDIRIAIDHMGSPDLSDGPPYEAARPMWELARHPNVCLKVSTMSVYKSGEGKSTPGAFFPRLVEKFGAQRLLWGSNFPNTYDRGLKEQLGLARETFAFLSPEEQRWLFGETALTFWPSLRG